MLPKTFTRTLAYRGGPGSNNRTPYRFIPEGKGGTLHFHYPPWAWTDARNKSLIKHVGTHSLKTCVGVFFQIDASRCFAAHINAYTFRNGGSSNKDLDRMIKTSAEAAWFREAVKEKLQLHAQANDWDPEVYRSEILESLLLLCPEPSNTWYPDIPFHLLPRNQTGACILEGIKDFLRAPSETPVLKSRGFVVEVPGGKPMLAEHSSVLWEGVGEHAWDRPKGPVEFRGFEERVEEGLEDWTIVRRA
ncbi:hypothetical protein LTR97_012696 [Elasticomyces elasticus]|uniref:Uncharacterized protein n=1 Tax=Elasticomyces elasticus TaxID=574655 RepID=A0AAN7VX77_9PEZI|nr:hypothetical protein LTR97_012696 [Elasticomyces elasticus]